MPKVGVLGQPTTICPHCGRSISSLVVSRERVPAAVPSWLRTWKFDRERREFHRAEDSL